MRFRTEFFSQLIFPLHEHGSQLRLHRHQLLFLLGVDANGVARPVNVLPFKSVLNHIMLKKAIVLFLVENNMIQQPDPQRLASGLELFGDFNIFLAWHQ